VSILVRDPHRRTLLQFRDASTTTFPLTWSFWGGAMSPQDPSPAHCAARELLEEIQIAATPGDFTRVGVRTSSRGEAWLMLYRHAVDWADFRVREGAGAAFLWRSEIARLPLSKPVAEHLRDDPDLFGDVPPGSAKLHP
jgi:8-oxo-dGTP pyrophosphatase MutT (NUDIX family)